MSEPLAILTWVTIVLTGIISVITFQRPDLEQALIFWPERILAHKEFYRTLTSGFIHANWFHLGMNMYSLFMFGRLIELVYGAASLAFIYLSSIIGGSLLSLLLHRHHDYRAYGASGGVCGVLFAYIFLFPGGEIMMLPLPVGIPTWLYAVLFMLGSFYGLKSQRGNVGHDAHLGGAIIGLLVTTALYPHIVSGSLGLYCTVLGLSVAIFIYLVLNPLQLPISAFLRESKPERSPDLPPPTIAAPSSLQLDAILEKISRSGIESLTAEEHKFLIRASRKDKPPN